MGRVLQPLGVAVGMIVVFTVLLGSCTRWP